MMIQKEDVIDFYNNIETIWDTEDKWHLYTKKRIHTFIQRTLKKTIDYSSDLEVLNAGSAGYSYGLSEDNILHIDIANLKIAHLKNSIIGDIQQMPINKKTFDIIICVGSVLNYCDAMKVFSEFDRVLKENGYIILEFENSKTLEIFGKPPYNKKATIVETFYKGKGEKLWLFSEKYIDELANLYNFKIIQKERFHILSPLVYRITKKEHIAAKFSFFDNVLSFLPFLGKNSSNIILLLNKI